MNKPLNNPLELCQCAVTHRYYFYCHTTSGSIAHGAMVDTPQRAWQVLVEEYGDTLTPYSPYEFREALRIAIVEQVDMPFQMFAGRLEAVLGNVPEGERPFYYWDGWLILARHVLAFARELQGATKGQSPGICGGPGLLRTDDTA